ncbi:molecular chaperone Hsp33 [Chitinivorax tropicus]|uniref:33 kDa chaperonin n=1 Tax=Chitinivorax tropicus TaxID=714531 RepID=A0A840MEZ9_9PROT|nr:Hsp33 family molecular chaperone HslO [Chitinivorax tropicus]MBB5016970.1 molecular chaperone Hsp33 [Chitinivorax tropicus]
MKDALFRFLFEGAPVRGELATLDQTYREVLARHDYPPVLRAMIGEMMAAAALLSATLKFNGSLIMQMHGTDAVRLVVVECNADLSMRATARWEGEVKPLPIRELLGNGKFVITLDPQNGQHPYQGVVSLEGDSIAAMLETYMLRSEQLETRFWLAANDHRATGLLLQKLPDSQGDEDAWERAGHLAGTLTEAELLEVPPKEIMHRLFHQEDLRVFDDHAIQFRCSCSRERVGSMLRMVGIDEIRAVLAEQGSIDIQCEFCNTRYEFDKVDVEQVFSSQLSQPATGTRH